jgi:MFS transporter, PPP family, 3-phenylpropionic acid transporter
MTQPCYTESMHPISPLRRFALVVCMFLITSTFGFLQPFLPLYMQASGLTLKDVGIVLGVSTGLALLLQPLLGRWSDRLDARQPIMIGAALAAGCAYLAFRSASNLTGFVLLSAIGTNGTMYLNAAGGVLVGRMAAGSGGGGAAYAGYRVWGSVGYIMVSLLCGVLLDRGRGADGVLTRTLLDSVFTFGPILFFAVAIVACLVPDLKRDALPVASTANPVEDSEEAAFVMSANLRWFLSAYFFYIFALYGASNYIAPYIQSLGGSVKMITGTFAAGVVCEVLVMTRVGRLTDVWGRRPALAVTFLLLPFRLLLYTLAATPTHILFVQLLHGINFGIMGTIAVVFANDAAAERHRGATQARLAATQGLATSIAPGVCGWLAARFGIPFMFAVMSGVALIGTLIFLIRVRESHTAPASLVAQGYAPLRPLWKLLAGR